MDSLESLTAHRAFWFVVAHAGAISAFVFMKTHVREERLGAGRRPVTAPPRKPRPRGPGTIAVTDTRRGMTDAGQRIARRLRELGAWSVVAGAGPYDQPERPRALIVVLDESWHPGELAAEDSDLGRQLTAMRRAGVRIVPVQIGEHRMPRPADVPETFEWFAFSNAQTIGLGSLDADVTSLAAELRR